jgi:zinc/manganese transport system substrate-binding protein
MILRLLLGCLIAFATASLAAADQLRVVASFSIIGDMAGRIAGDHAHVTTLVGPDADAHVFEPTPASARALARAKVFVTNGLGFEPWAERLLKSTKSSARLVVVSAGVKLLPFHTLHGEERGAADPHAWQDARNAIVYAQNIAHAFVTADPAHAKTYESNAAAYAAELAELDADIRAEVSRIPVKQRRVITTHDAFAYFGRAYDVTFIAPLGTSTEEEASAKEVAALITQIRREKITAVFVENIADPRMIQQIARETGVKLGGKLYSDALSTKAGEAPTYIALMRHNAKLLTAAMARGL